MLISRAADLATSMAERTDAALHAMGEAACLLVRNQMREGYDQPVVDTGALLASIVYVIEGNTLHVGSPLPYAPHVHDGTARMAGRPFLADGILGGMDVLEAAAALALRL